MPATVRIGDIVEALELQFEENSSRLNLEAGEVETVSSDHTYPWHVDAGHLTAQPMAQFEPRPN